MYLILINILIFFQFDIPTYLWNFSCHLFLMKLIENVYYTLNNNKYNIRQK